MEELTIYELQVKMESGELTAHSTTQMYLERIEQIDKQTINSVIEINPDALAIADARDAERRASRVRGPMHGIPILIKDNIDTHDRMTTTAGSLALEGSIAPRDAFIVKRLRAAGAVLLGKTNLSEWANFRGKHSTSGWSSRGGLTRNPYALDRSACGSSSGSGAAVAANLCAAAIGTETDGSIICPSQTNGIVGIKPTLGLVSRSGIIPIAHSQDTAGPMTRTVADAALVLGALTGVDERDSITLRQRSGQTRRSVNRALIDYSPFLGASNLNGLRIGVARNMAGSDKRIDAIFETCVDVLKQLGATIIDPANVPNFNKFGNTELDVLHYEFKADLNKYLATLGKRARVKTMADVIKFNEENKTRVLTYFGQEHMETAQDTAGLRDKKYRDALAKNQRLTQREGIDAAMKKHKLDALIVPSGGPAWMIDLVGGDASNWDMESTAPAAVAGYPHITVPAGYIFGLPVGLSFFAGAWQEGMLIRMAYAFEQATKVRQPPQFLAHAEV
jgi:amidase